MMHSVHVQDALNKCSKYFNYGLQSHMPLRKHMIYISRKNLEQILARVED